MKRLGVILAAFVLMGSLSGTACGGETTKKGENSIAQGLYEWERATLMFYESDYDENRNLSGVRTKVEDTYYAFETGVSEWKRENFISTCESIAAKTGERAEYVYAGESYSYSVKDGKAVFLPIEADNAEIAAGILSLNYALGIPYGAAYALGYGVCKEAGLDLPEICSDEELQETLRAKPETADLTLPLFYSDFSTEEQKQAARALSVKLYETAGKERLESLLKEPVRATLEDKFSGYIKGICYRLDTPLPFEIGIPEYEFSQTQKYLVADNERVRFSFRFGYEDISYKYFDSYAELKTFLRESLPAFEKVRALVNPKYAKKVWFLMDEIETRRMNVGGITFSNGFVICGKVGAVCHEYAHAVSEDFMERTESYWTGEALPMYCGASFGTYYAEELLNIYIKSEIEKDSPYYEYYQSVKKMIWQYPTADGRELSDLLAYCFESLFPGEFIRWGTEPYGGYQALQEQVGASLTNYLLQTYGEEKYLKLYYGKDETEERVYKKTFDELRAEWFETLKSKYEK